MYKVILSISIVFATVFTVNGQAVDPNRSVLDEVYTQDTDVGHRKPVEYANLRSADVMWSKRIWREIDLNEKFNQVFYFPEVPSQGRMNMFDIITNAVFSGQLTAYDAGLFGDNDMFTVPLTAQGALGKMTDTSYVNKYDDNGNIIGIDTITERIASTKIKKYVIKEDVFFDKQRSVLEYRILGMAPLKEVEVSGIVSEVPCFWIYFPHARDLFAQSEVYNPYNNAKRLTYDDVFFKRMFSSTIIKEDNTYDRGIDRYKSGLDALLEAEDIKEDIFLFEHDLWSY